MNNYTVIFQHESLNSVDSIQLDDYESLDSFVERDIVIEDMRATHQDIDYASIINRNDAIAIEKQKKRKLLEEKRLLAIKLKEEKIRKQKEAAAKKKKEEEEKLKQIAKQEELARIAEEEKKEQMRLEAIQSFSIVDISDAITSHVSNNMNSSINIKSSSWAIVEVMFNMDGSVKKIRILDMSSDSVRIFKREVKRAIMNLGKLEAPVELYDKWKSIVINIKVV